MKLKTKKLFLNINYKYLLTKMNLGQIKDFYRYDYIACKRAESLIQLNSNFTIPFELNGVKISGFRYILHV